MIAEVAHDIRRRIPERIVTPATPDNLQQSAFQDSMHTVLLQEIVRFNR
jgi:hypothetical protein